eukprot:TRINITY_DN2354_c0_g1_i1.p1 TRINITY_DN2354_c0_g1~~TRINITY_DN2354_c0_g1_i1.p1  ORF type:complete len:1075 (+),score=303.09 TRINITY_DN2354_c0_g1_i1:86-3226(+)
MPPKKLSQLHTQTWKHKAAESAIRAAAWLREQKCRQTYFTKLRMWHAVRLYSRHLRHDADGLGQSNAHLQRQVSFMRRQAAELGAAAEEERKRADDAEVQLQETELELARLRRGGGGGGAGKGSADRRRLEQMEEEVRVLQEENEELRGELHRAAADRSVQAGGPSDEELQELRLENEELRVELRRRGSEERRRADEVEELRELHLENEELREELRRRGSEARRRAADAEELRQLGQENDELRQQLRRARQAGRPDPDADPDEQRRLAEENASLRERLRGAGDARRRAEELEAEERRLAEENASLRERLRGAGDARRRAEELEAQVRELEDEVEQLRRLPAPEAAAQGGGSSRRGQEGSAAGGSGRGGGGAAGAGEVPADDPYGSVGGNQDDMDTARSRIAELESDFDQERRRNIGANRELTALRRERDDLRRRLRSDETAQRELQQLREECAKLKRALGDARRAAALQPHHSISASSAGGVPSSPASGASARRERFLARRAERSPRAEPAPADAGGRYESSSRYASHSAAERPPPPPDTRRVRVARAPPHYPEFGLALTDTYPRPVKLGRRRGDGPRRRLDGIKVVGVRNAARRAGVRPDDILLEVNGTTVATLAAFRDAVVGLPDGAPAVLLVERAEDGGVERLEFTVCPGRSLDPPGHQFQRTVWIPREDGSGLDVNRLAAPRGMVYTDGGALVHSPAGSRCGSPVHCDACSELAHSPPPPAGSRRRWEENLRDTREDRARSQSPPHSSQASPRRTSVMPDGCDGAWAWAGTPTASPRAGGHHRRPSGTEDEVDPDPSPRGSPPPPSPRPRQLDEGPAGRRRRSGGGASPGRRWANAPRATSTNGPSGAVRRRAPAAPSAAERRAAALQRSAAGAADSAGRTAGAWAWSFPEGDGPSPKRGWVGAWVPDGQAGERATDHGERRSSIDPLVSSPRRVHGDALGGISPVSGQSARRQPSVSAPAPPPAPQDGERRRQELQSLKQAAVDAHDFEEAARLRDELRALDGSPSSPPAALVASVRSERTAPQQLPCPSAAGESACCSLA